MEVHFSAEKQSLINQIAARMGKDSVQLVEEAVDRLLEYDAHFISAVEEGRADVHRGNLLEHKQVVDRIEKVLRRK